MKIKAPMFVVNSALLLLLLNAFGGQYYIYSLTGQVNISALMPRLCVLVFLCSMAHLERNWARLILGILSTVAAIGMAATVALHFYTGSEGNPHFLTIINLVVFSVVAVFLLIPKSVRVYFKEAKTV